MSSLKLTEQESMVSARRENRPGNVRSAVSHCAVVSHI